VVDTVKVPESCKQRKGGNGREIPFDSVGFFSSKFGVFSLAERISEAKI
jgi:hypothetical protein